MQPNQISLKKAVWLYSFAFATVLLVNLSSCKQDEKPVKGQCITFSNAKMKKAWSKPGYLKKIEYIKFVTYYNSVNNEIKVFAQAYSKDYKPIGDLITLSTGDKCPLNLAPVAVPDNMIDLKNFHILNDKGELKEFDFVSLIPFKDKNYYLQYETTVMGSKETVEPYSTLPCPPCPNCKPPCPEPDTLNKVSK